MTLLFVGDANLGRTVGRKLQAGQVDYPFAALRPVVESADFACVALECQVSDIPGTVGEPGSYVYCAPAVAAETVRRAGFDAVWCANNHAWDFGELALLDTIANLDRAGLPHTGIGFTPDEAHAAAVVERKGWRIAVLSVTSIFNSAFEGRPAQRIAWANQEKVRRAVEQVRARADFVCLNHHAGVEYSPKPTRDTIEFNRSAIEAGVDLVVGSHPHVFQGGEWWRGKPIFYSVGNLVFEQRDPWTDAGLGIRVTLRDGQEPSYEIIALKAAFQPSVVASAGTARYRERFRRISAEFPDPVVWADDGTAARQAGVG